MVNINVQKARFFGEAASHWAQFLRQSNLAAEMEWNAAFHNAAAEAGLGKYAQSREWEKCRRVADSAVPNSPQARARR